MLTNLGQETREFLKDLPEVEGIYYFDFVDQKYYKTNLEQFLEIADQFNYDSGYGSQFVSNSLSIKFVDGSFAHRHEYDGAEWWVYDKAPQAQEEKAIESKNLYMSEEDYIYDTFGPDSEEYKEWEKKEYGEDE